MTSLSRILPDGSLYSGQWSPETKTAPQGLGIRHYLSSRLYVGDWENGVMHGKGLMLLENGDIFEGSFARGAYHGRGFLFSRADGRAKRGVWKHGTLLSVEDVIGNADDANFGVAFRSGPAASAASHNVPHFKMMELTAIAQTMLDLRARLEAQKKDPVAAAASMEGSVLGLTPDSSVGAGGGGGGGGVVGGDYQLLSANPSMVLAPPGPTTAAAAAAPLPGTSNNNTNEPTTTMVGSASVFAGVGIADFNQNPQHQHQQAAGGVLSNQLLLTISGPSYNFSFSALRFLQFLGLFTFPFLSLPHVPICPLRVDGLDLEREYVVSGAALRADFEIPTWEIYFGSVAILFLVVAGAIPYTDNFVGVGFQTEFAWSDIIVPTVLCFLFALLQAAYHGYHRTAHALERLDRHHFPRLAALSAQCIDANCHTLVVSWDEEGLGRVLNKKYQYKWGVLSFLYGFLLAFAAPLTRILRGQSAFGNAHDRTEASAVLSFLSVWVISSGITYQLWRIIDLERQLEESMGVITRCAYLRGQSILRPSDTRKFKFHFDAPVSLEQTSAGFLGWYITRSFALYASTLANHRSRHAFVSVLALAALAVDAAVIVDTFRSLGKGAITYTTAQGFSVFCIFGWTLMLLYFLYVAKSIDSETKRHLYLADVAVMFHNFRDTAGANVIARCRGMIAEHDYTSRVLGVQISDKVFALACSFHGLAVSCMIVSLVMWIFHLQGKTSELLVF